MHRVLRLIFFLWAGGVSGQDLPIRAAYWDLRDYTHPDPLPDDFLARAKAADYNYVMVNFPFPNPRLGAAHHLRTGPEWRDRLRRHFLQADKHGMRLVPRLEMSSKWSRSWTDLIDDYPDIQLSIKGAKFCNSFGPEPATKVVGGASRPVTVPFRGIDKAFADALADIKDAFKASGLAYPLAYLGIGHDEPVEGDVLLVGNRDNTDTWTNPAYPARHYGGPNSTLDRDFLAGHGGLTNSGAYQQLFANEISRRVIAVQTAFGAGSPKVIVDADMWDPQANGGLWKSTNGGSIRLVDAARVNQGDYYQGLATLPGLSAADAANVRDNIILAPWNYYSAWPWNSDPDKNGKYDADKTYAYFIANGFDFVVFGWNDPKADRSGASLAEGNAALQVCARAAENFRGISAGGAYLGYIAGVWVPSSDRTFGNPVWDSAAQRWEPPFWDTRKRMYEQMAPFRTLESMRNLRIAPPSGGGQSAP